MNTKYSRIVSLVPSLTELLIDLGLGERIVGRTRFCIHPEDEMEGIPVIGGTKNPVHEKIDKVNPDFILVNREENRREDIELLSRSYHLHLTDISTIEDALIEIHELGHLLGAPVRAKQLIGKISAQLEIRPDEPPINTAYLIWRDPWMTVGSDTYIHDVMRHWRLVNVFADRKRYPKTDLTLLKKRRPSLVLLSSEPYPFKEKHISEIGKILPESRILLADGEWFSWYGSRMLPSFRNLNVWRKAIA